MGVKKLWWDYIVDLITITWLFFFVLGFIRSDLENLCDIINLSLLPVFVTDLVLKYREVKSLRIFLRYYWFDILITIPYFRFLRAFRILKISRAVRTVKTVKIAKGSGVTRTIRKILKVIKAVKKLKKRILKCSIKP